MMQLETDILVFVDTDKEKKASYLNLKVNLILTESRNQIFLSTIHNWLLNNQKATAPRTWDETSEFSLLSNVLKIGLNRG